MARNWTAEELAAVLARQAAFKVRRVEIPPTISTNCPKVQTLKTPPSSSNGIHELMACPSYQGALQPEESLSVAVATELRRLTHAGKLRAVWSRLPLEHPEGGRYGMQAQCKRIAMGGVPGAPDLWFCWNEGAGLIELKVAQSQSTMLTPSGKLGIRKGRRTYLNGRQKLFAAWAQAHGVRHAVARSVPEVLAVLKQWGVLDD